MPESRILAFAVGRGSKWFRGALEMILIVEKNQKMNPLIYCTWLAEYKMVIAVSLESMHPMVMRGWYCFGEECGESAPASREDGCHVGETSKLVLTARRLLNSNRLNPKGASPPQISEDVMH